jgi:hypothetical protein
LREQGKTYDASAIARMTELLKDKEQLNAMNNLFKAFGDNQGEALKIIQAHFALSTQMAQEVTALWNYYSGLKDKLAKISNDANAAY